MHNKLLKNETDYKLQLIDFILSKSENCVISSELPFAFQKRRADIIILNNSTTHAIEIKSDVDNIYNLKSQLDDYTQTFNQVSILVSKKHLAKLNNLSKNIGIFIFNDGNITQNRTAKARVKINKRLALDLLSTEELKELSKTKKRTRTELISELEKTLTYKNINTLSYNSLVNKLKPIYSLFLSERIGNTSIHDLSLLEIRNPNI